MPLVKKGAQFMLKHQKHLQPRGQHSAEVVALRVEVFEKHCHCKVRTGDATNGEPGSAIKAIEDAGKRRAVASRNQRGQMRGYQYSRVGKEAEKGKQKRLYVDRVVDRALRCFFEIDALGKSCKQIDQSDRYKFTQHRSAVQTTRCGLAAGSSLRV